jgi:hypothetical protein
MTDNRAFSKKGILLRKRTLETKNYAGFLSRTLPPEYPGQCFSAGAAAPRGLILRYTYHFTICWGI